MNPILNRILIFVAGITTIAVGLLVLIGWHFDIELLKSPQAGTVSMKANAAVAFIFSGLALILIQQTHSFSRTVVRICGILIALIGLLTLCEYLVGWELGIDKILLRESTHAIETSSPGRMAPNTALNFALLGFAFILLSFQTLRNKFIIYIIIIISLSISILGLLGSTTNLLGFSEIGSVNITKMAFHTCLIFIFLCTGILSTLNRNQSKTIVVKQRLFAGQIVFASILVFAYLLFYSNIKTINEVSRFIDQNQETNREINSMLADVMVIETDSRKLIRNIDSTDFKHLLLANERLTSHLIHLQSLAIHPDLKSTLDTLSSLTKRSIVSTENLYNSYSTKGNETSGFSLKTKAGEILKDSIHIITNKMILASNNLLNEEIISESGILKNNKRILYGSLIMQLLLLTIIFLIVVKYILTKKKSEVSLQNLNNELENKVIERTEQLSEVNKDLIVQIYEKTRLADQLEIYHIEIESKNEELLQTKETAEIVAEKYTELYDFAPTGYFTLTRNGEIDELNIHGSRMLGKEQRLLIKSRFGFFVSDETKSAFNHFLGRVYESNVMEECEVTIRGDNNLIRDLNLTGIVGCNSDQCLVTAVDITERKKAAEENKKLNRVYAVVSSINQAIVRIGEKQQLYEEVCRIAVKEGKFLLAWIGILDEPSNKIIPVAVKGKAKEYIKTLDIDLNDENFGNGVSGRTVKTGVHFISNDIANNPEMIPWREKALQFGFQSAAAFPIQEFGKTIGTFILYSDQTFFFNKEEVELFDEMARDISYACEFIENKNIRQLAEEKLHKSNERFTHLVSNLNEVVWYSSIDESGIIEVNDSFEKIYGISADAYKSNPGIWLEMVHPDDRHIAEWSQEELEKKGTAEAEYRIIRPDGSVIWLSDKKSVIKDNQGVAVQKSGIVKDITDRKQSEQALFLSNARNLAILNAIPDLMFRINHEGLILEYRVQTSSNLYTPPEIITGSKISDLLPPDVAFLIERHIKLLLESSKIQVFEYELTMESILRYYEARMVISSEFEIVAIIHDITERKLIAEKVKESEKKYRTLVNEVNDGFYIIDKHGNLSFANEGLAHILGFNESNELIGHNISEFIPEESLEEVIGRFMFSIKNKISTGSFELNARQITGKEIVISISSVLIQENNHAFGFRGIIRDISEQKHSEKLKRRQSEILESIIRRTPIPVILELIVKLAETENANSYCSILLLNNEGTHLQIAAAPTLPEFYKQENDNLEIGEKIGSNGAAAFLKKIVIAEDVLTHPNWIPYRELTKVVNLRSCWSLPILDSKNEVLGTFAIYHNTPKSPTNKDLEILKSIVDLASIAISNNRIEEEIQKVNAELEIKVDKRTTQLSETNSKLTKAKVLAEDANKMKSEFLANMSHEIRTPLNSIVGFSSILKEKLTGENLYVEYLDNIMQSSKILLNLIGDILDLSKVEAGRMIIDLQPVNLNTLIKEVKSIFRMKASEKGLSLNFIINNDIPKQLIIDEKYLRQILFNLIGNAVKFTHKGSVNVLVSASPKDIMSSKVDLKFSITDTGIGIPADQLGTIFDPFIQASKKDRNRYGGTGLGLSITRRLIELLGGTISVESEENMGSVFTFSLLDVEIGSLLCEETENSNMPSLTGLKFKKPIILLTEDILSNRQVIKGYLETLNITIIEAENGEECLSAIQKQRPDLILMDMQMPVMDGFTAIKIIKSDKLLKDIPIIALTASGMKQQKDHIKNIADDFLIKPIYKNDLVVKLMKYLAYDNLSVKEVNQALIVDKHPRVNTGQKLPPEIKDEISSLFMETISKQMGTFNMDEMIAFVAKLEDYNTNKQIPEITEFCNLLSAYLKSFNIEKIDITLEQLASYIKK